MGIKKTLPAEVTERIKELGYRVRLARTRRGMSIAELAAKVGINRNTLNALELGKHGVAIGAYVTVLWALGLVTSYTMGGFIHILLVVALVVVLLRVIQGRRLTS